MGQSVLVIGAGAAGLLAAYGAASHGARVVVLEKNKQPGLKLLISGAGRCNLTNTAALDNFIAAFFEQGRFLYPAFQRFFRPELLVLLAQSGVETRSEPSGKVFPRSDQATDVRNALWSACRAVGVTFRFNETVQELLTEPLAQEETCNDSAPSSRKKYNKPVCTHRILGVRTLLDDTCRADSVILACGGSSWPKTGSSGDGYRMAGAVGHTVTAVRPALVALNCSDTWIRPLSGISCSDVQVDLTQNGRLCATTKGDLLWTHFGVSGPAVLRLSRAYQPVPGCRLTSPDHWQLIVNLLPDTGLQDILAYLNKGCAQQPRSLLHTVLANASFGRQDRPVPRALAVTLVRLLEETPVQNLTAGQATAKQLRQLAGLLRYLSLTVSGSRGYREAMVTAGGLSLKEIDPRTMMSKRVYGLYAAGEVLDIDADTGGYNLQAAFSTGYLAGTAAADSK